MMKARGLFLIVMMSVLAVLFGCSGGGGGGGGGSSSSSSGGSSADPLALAEKVSVVGAKQAGVTQQAEALVVRFEAIDLNALPAGSDYHQDETNIWVQERSAEGFNIVNEILCSISQSKYDLMLNKGAYRAQIDINQCNQERDEAASDGSSQNRSSADSQPRYENWTVTSTRADNSSPHIVRVWINQEADHEMPPMQIQAKAVITEGASEENPYGIFNMNFIAYPVVNGQVVSNSAMKGYLRSEYSGGDVQISFIVNEPFGAIKSRFISRDDGSGSGSTYEYWNDPMWGEELKEFNFAFNETFFYRQSADGSPMCLDRDAFDETIWRYGVYDSSGQRVQLNSGFPITANGYHGFVGYYGLWMPEEAQITNGSVVSRVSFDDNGGTVAEDYTVVKYDGKLTKHVRELITLQDIVGVPLHYWAWDEMTQTGSEYRVTWNGVNFMRSAHMDESWNWVEETPTVFDVTNPEWPELHFWSQALGGDIQVKLACTEQWDNMTYRFTFTCSTPTNTTPGVFYSRDVVDPLKAGLVPSGLACFDNCPDVAAIAQGQQDPYNNYWGEKPASGLTEGADYTGYTFSDMLLNAGGTPVTAGGTSYQNGIWSGPLFELNTAALAALDCGYTDPATGDPLICPWKAWTELPEYYTWETGPNEWNQYTAVQRASDGTFVVFDPPVTLKLRYTNPDLGYNNTSFNLEYNGFDVWGIPGKCVDEDTGAEAQCDYNTRWVPQFNLPAGQNAVNALDGTIEYIIKPLEGEQRMQLSNKNNIGDTSACTGAGLVLEDFTLPGITGWTDPAIGAEPQVDGPPAVIGGMLQLN